MKKEGYFSSKRITSLAILLALVIVLQAVLGVIQIGAVQLNFTLIPIVLGAIILGPISGAILGFACGVVVLIQVILGGTPFYTIIWLNSPIITVLICILKTTVAGFVAGVLYKIFAKKHNLIGVFVASATVPIINTALFILGCLVMNDTIIMFQNSLIEVMPEVSGMNVLVFVLIVLVTFNFFIELFLNLFVSPALYRVIGIVNKRLAK
ncbi:MAG: ECF transporter S component [Clostridiales bacterium]|nr:ECF transporter S component [Clostridiales bacterium]